MKCRGLTLSEKDVVYLAWSNYTKGYAAGWAAAKAELEGQ
jgi:hypothetical protein